MSGLGFIEELELGVRAYNLCKRHGIDTWADLAGVSVQDLNRWAVEGDTAHAPIGLEGARSIAEAQRTIARAANPSREWTDEQADLLAAAAVGSPAVWWHHPDTFEGPHAHYPELAEFAVGLGEIDGGGA